MELVLAGMMVLYVLVGVLAYAVITLAQGQREVMAQMVVNGDALRLLVNVHSDMQDQQRETMGEMVALREVMGMEAQELRGMMRLETDAHIVAGAMKADEIVERLDSGYRMQIEAVTQALAGLRAEMGALRAWLEAEAGRREPATTMPRAEPAVEMLTEVI